MDNHAATYVKDLEDVNEDCFVQAVEENFEGGHCPELENTALAENGSKGYQYCACPEVSQNEMLIVQGNFLP